MKTDIQNYYAFLSLFKTLLWPLIINTDVFYDGLLERCGRLPIQFKRGVSEKQTCFM